MKKFRTKLFDNGDEIAFVDVPVSQKDRFETLVRQLARYALRFDHSIQYSTELIEEED
jgi:hypothetical protein